MRHARFQLNLLGEQVLPPTGTSKEPSRQSHSGDEKRSGIATPRAVELFNEPLRPGSFFNWLWERKAIDAARTLYGTEGKSELLAKIEREPAPTEQRQKERIARVEKLWNPDRAYRRPLKTTRFNSNEIDSEMTGLAYGAVDELAKHITVNSKRKNAVVAVLSLCLDLIVSECDGLAELSSRELSECLLARTGVKRSHNAIREYIRDMLKFPIGAPVLREFKRATCNGESNQLTLGPYWSDTQMFPLIQTRFESTYGYPMPKGDSIIQTVKL